jgi:hypothetical protein
VLRGLAIRVKIVRPEGASLHNRGPDGVGWLVVLGASAWHLAIRRWRDTRPMPAVIRIVGVPRWMKAGTPAVTLGCFRFPRLLLLLEARPKTLCRPLMGLTAEI